MARAVSYPTVVPVGLEVVIAQAPDRGRLVVLRVREGLEVCTTTSVLLVERAQLH